MQGECSLHDEEFLRHSSVFGMLFADWKSCLCVPIDWLKKTSRSLRILTSDSGVLREVLFVDRNLLASVKKFWCLVRLNPRNCGWNDECSGGLIPCMSTTRRFKILRVVTLKIIDFWNVALVVW
jgi:hypothetical protein